MTKYEKQDRAQMIERHIQENGAQRIPYLGKPQAYKEWESREARRTSLNRSTALSHRNKGPRQAFFLRGQGTV